MSEETFQKLFRIMALTTLAVFNLVIIAAVIDIMRHL